MEGTPPSLSSISRQHARDGSAAEGTAGRVVRVSAVIRGSARSSGLARFAAAFLSVLVAALLPLGEAGSVAATSASEGGGADEPVRRALDRLIEPLRIACGCESLRVDWRLTSALSAEAAGADSLEAVIAGDAGGSLDRPVARVRSWRAGRLREVMVSGDALCAGIAWIARRPLRARSEVAATDVDSARGWFAPSVIAGAGRSPVGAWTQHALSRGRPIAIDRLGETPLVQAGGEVRLVCRTGALRVEGRGVARSDARLGDDVEVRLDGGKRDCRGVVSGPAEVTVLLEGGAR